jgi:hypothetical protein
MFNPLDILFGCLHTNYSFPRTVKPGQRRPEAAALTGTYVVCLDCGKEFAYDWQQMRMVTAPKPACKIQAVAAKPAA